MLQMKEALLLAEKNDHLFVLDIESGRVHSFNCTAKVIVQLCLDPILFEDLVLEFQRYFPISRGEAEEDIREVLAMMNKYGLLREHGPDDV
jgi:hypothetical protein